MTDITPVIDYYINLLIIQYRDKQKARATIETLVKTKLNNGTQIDVRDGFDINNAIGKQLDILGRYIGIDRNISNTYVEISDNTFFGFRRRNVEPSNNIVGFRRRGDPVSNNLFFRIRNHIVSNNLRLYDNVYRNILRFKISSISISFASIRNSLRELFGDNAFATTDRDLSLTIFARVNIAEVDSYFRKDVIPSPAGITRRVARFSNRLFTFKNRNNINKLPTGRGVGFNRRGALIEGNIFRARDLIII